MNTFQHLTLSFFLIILTYTLYPHANFDFALLRVYEKHPPFKKTTLKATAQNSTSGSEKLYKAVLITTGIRLSRLYYVHQKNTNARWLYPAFLCRWEHNLYFFSDASRIVLQAMIAKFIIKRLFCSV